MRNCEACIHFAEFKDPFRYDADGYEDGVTAYGVCYKNCKNHTCYPVYIPNGGTCKTFKKKPGLEHDLLQEEAQCMIGGFVNG